jgi:hypothetical protein
MKCLILLITFMISSSSSLAPIFAEDQIQATIQPSGSLGYVIQGRFTLQASEHVVWGVLTDYERLHSFVDNMKMSKIVRREPDFTFVHQKFTGKYLLFTKAFTVLLKVQELPLQEITFEDVSHESFQLYKGSWRIQRKDSENLTVHYQLVFRSDMKVPKGIEKGLALKNVRKLLGQIRKQIACNVEPASLNFRATVPAN